MGIQETGDKMYVKPFYDVRKEESLFRWLMMEDSIEQAFVGIYMDVILYINRVGAVLDRHMDAPYSRRKRRSRA